MSFIVRASKRGCGAFAEAWDVEVATRFKEKASGNDEVILIYRKSVKQLQDHCDSIQKHMHQASLVRPNDDNREHMDRASQDSRRNRVETQAAQPTQPPTFATNERPSFGNPTTLNTAIAANAFLHNNNQATLATAPFALRPIRHNNSRLLLGSNFNRNKYCWRCGYSKKIHSDYGVPFGHSCVDNCLREDCAKCGERSEFHHGGKTAMGPTCMKAPSPNSQYADWYGHNR